MVTGILVYRFPSKNMVDLQALWSPLRSSRAGILGSLLNGRGIASILLITAFLIKKIIITARNILTCSYEPLADRSFGLSLCVGFRFWFLAIFPKA